MTVKSAAFLLALALSAPASPARAASRLGRPVSAAFHPCFAYDVGCATVWIITHGNEGWVRVRPDSGVVLNSLQLFIKGFEFDSPAGVNDWVRPVGSAFFYDPTLPFQPWMVDSDFGGGFDLFTSGNPVLGCGDWASYLPWDEVDAAGNVIRSGVDTIPLWPESIVACSARKRPAWALFHLTGIAWSADDVGFDPRISAPPVSTAPEPGVLVLAATGLGVLAPVARWRAGRRRERA